MATKLDFETMQKYWNEERRYVGKIAVNSDYYELIPDEAWVHINNELSVFQDIQFAYIELVDKTEFYIHSTHSQESVGAILNMMRAAFEDMYIRCAPLYIKYEESENGLHDSFV